MSGKNSVAEIIRGLVAEWTEPELEEFVEIARTLSGNSGRFIARTLGEVAEFFRIHPQTAKEWHSAQGMPGKAGEYDLSEIVRWRIERITSALPLSQLTREKGEIENARRRLKLEIERKEVVNRAEAEAEFRTMARRIVARLLALPDEMATEIAPQQRSETLSRMRGLIQSALREISDWSREGPKVEEGVKDD